MNQNLKSANQVKVQQSIKFYESLYNDFQSTVTTKLVLQTNKYTEHTGIFQKIIKSY